MLNFNNTMATFLSQTYIPQEKRQDTNFPLLAQIMQMKQGQYDTNRAKVQQTLDAFGIQSQQVLRQEDKDYIAKKLSDVTNQINEYGSRDLSQSGITENIIGSIRTVASDPIIQNAIQNTQKFNKFQKDVATLKEKNPELYSDINYNYALEQSGLKDYIDGKTNTIGNLEYTPYTDYNKKVNDSIIDLLGKKGTRTIQTKVVDANGNPTGEIQEVEIDGMSPRQLRSVATSMLDVNDLKQIEIDGWYKNQGNSNPQLFQNYNNKLKETVSFYENKVEQSTGREKQKYETLLAQSNQELQSLNKNKQALLNDPKAMSTYIERNSVIDNIVTRFAPLYTENTSFSKDDAYWARKNYELNLAKEQRQAQESLLKQQEKYSVDNISVVAKGTGDLDPLPTIEKAIQTQIDETSQALDVTLRQIKEGLKQEAINNPKAKKQWEDLNNRLTNKTKGQTDTEVIQKWVTENKSTNNPIVLMNEQGENLFSKFNNLSDELLFVFNAREEATQKWRDIHIDATLDTEQKFEYFNDSMKGKNATMLWKGKAVPVHQVLKSEGLMGQDGTRLQSLKDKPEVLDSLIKSYYANDAINKAEAGIHPNKLKYVRKDNKSIKELAYLNKESLEDIYISNIPEGLKMNPENQAVYGYIINPNTKTGQYLLQAKQQGIYDRFGLVDNSLVGDDSDIEQFITKDYREQEGYKQDLNRFRQKLPNQQQIAFSYDDDKAIFNNLIKTAQNKNNLFSRNEDSSIRIRQEGNEIILESTDKVKQGETPTASIARLSLPEFQQNFPSLSQRLDYTKDSALYTYERMGNKPLLSEPIKFIKNGDQDLFDYNSQVVLEGREKYIKYLTKEDSRKFLIGENQMLTQMVPQFDQVVDKVLEESQQYGVQIKFSKSYKGSPKLNLMLVNKKTGESINTLSLDNITEADDFKKVLDEAPQVYFSVLLDNIFKKQISSLGTYQTNDPSYLELIKSLNK